MKIIRYKRNRNGSYTVFLENECSYDFYEEIILKYELLLKKDISIDMLELLQQENQKWDSYYTALRIINKIPKTKKELLEYLKKKGYCEENYLFTIETLEKQGYINDTIYAKSYVHNQILTTYHGPDRIRRDLEQKGIVYTVYQEALNEYTLELQKEKMKKIISKKIQANHNKSNMLLKKKIYNELILDGFDKTIASEMMETFNFHNDMEIAKKEYDKIYRKLSKKYTGKELEYKIKQKMYNLGFSTIDID